MAKKGNRVQVILECTSIRLWKARNISLHHHQEQNTPDRMELKNTTQS